MDVSNNTLYFTDVSNRRVRAVDLATGVIATVAGGGSAETGDGGPATAASLSTHPMRVLAQGDDLYISDATFQRVRRVDGSTGTISTVAGTGAETFTGDGVPAAAAGLAEPHGARFDGQGNLHIADSRNSRIRRIDAGTGLITTVAGNGRAEWVGDDIPAVESGLHFPLALAFDAEDNLYIVDCDNDRIRRVDAATGQISTAAGIGEIGPLEDGVAVDRARFGRLRDVTAAADGSLIAVDGDNSLVFRIDLSEGVIHYVAGTGTAGFSGDGGPAAAAQLNSPYRIALDPEQNLFIKDCKNTRIRRVDAATGTITTVAGNGESGFSGDGGPALEARLAIG